MDTKKYNHSINNEGLWTIFDTSNISTIIPKNIIHIQNLFSDKHYHLYLKYWVANAIYKWDNIDLWRKLYDKMQILRIWKTKFNEFDKMLNKIFWWDFNFKEPIPIDNAFNILDWSHRLAWFATISKHPYVEVLNYASHDYNKEWFLNSWFSEQEIKLIESSKKDFFQKFYWDINNKQLWFIWWSTIQELWQNWEKILEIIWFENLADFYIRNFGTQLNNIINLTYLWDKIDNELLLEKNNWINKRSKWLIGIITFEDIWNEKINLIKQKTRNTIKEFLSEYYFDSIIHTVDEAHPLSNKIRSEIKKRVYYMNSLLYI